MLQKNKGVQFVAALIGLLGTNFVILGNLVTVGLKATYLFACMMGACKPWPYLGVRWGACILDSRGLGACQREVIFFGGADESENESLIFFLAGGVGECCCSCTQAVRMVAMTSVSRVGPELMCEFGV